MGDFIINSRSIQNQHALLALFAVLALNLLMLPASSAQNEPQQALEDIRSELQQLESEQEQAIRDRSKAQDQLRDIEKRAVRIREQQRETESKLAANKTEREQLEQERRALLMEMNSKAAQLASAMKMSFAISRLDSLKLLLSQDNPSRVSRINAYYRYFTASQVEQIDQLREFQNKLDDSEKGLAESHDQLELLTSELEEQEQNLTRSQTEKQQMLAKLEQQLSSMESKISDAQSVEQQLLGLIDGLRKNETVVESSKLPKGRFEKQKGKLNLPAKASISAKFGEPKHISGIYWEGLFLDTSRGQEVHSIHEGRVVFSDWLRGFGQLVIVDHGDGYMSLYAHNDWLSRFSGDEVRAGDVIALAGSTGGLLEPGLYFELRKDGKPINPLLWFNS